MDKLAAVTVIGVCVALVVLVVGQAIYEKRRDRRVIDLRERIEPYGPDARVLREPTTVTTASARERTRTVTLD